ncbi:MAG: hypothetical protein WA364_10300 [Candidatus Nitrosopolaris sp.]
MTEVLHSRVKEIEEHKLLDSTIKSANVYGSHAPISANLYGSHGPISANHGFSTIISNLYGGHGFASPYGPCGGQPFTTIGKHIICTTR